MTPELLLACGCAIRFREDQAILCAVHGPQRVVRSLGMPAPRIRGVASGPHVITADLAPFVGRIVGSEPKAGVTHE